MKKGLFGLTIILGGVLLFTGCGKDSSTIVCTYENSDSSYEEKLEGILDEDGKVKEVRGTVTFNDSDTAKDSYENAKGFYGDNVKLDGKKIIISKLEEDSYKNAVGKTKDEFIEIVKSVSDGSSKVTCK